MIEDNDFKVELKKLSLIGLNHVLKDNDITIGELNLYRAEPCDKG